MNEELKFRLSEIEDNYSQKCERLRKVFQERIRDLTASLSTSFSLANKDVLLRQLGDDKTSAGFMTERITEIVQKVINADQEKRLQDEMEKNSQRDSEQVMALRRRHQEVLDGLNDRIKHIEEWNTQLQKEVRQTTEDYRKCEAERRKLLENDSEKARMRDLVQHSAEREVKDLRSRLKNSENKTRQLETSLESAKLESRHCMVKTTRLSELLVKSESERLKIKRDWTDCHNQATKMLKDHEIEKDQVKRDIKLFEEKVRVLEEKVREREQIDEANNKELAALKLELKEEKDVSKKGAETVDQLNERILSLQKELAEAQAKVVTEVNAAVKADQLKLHQHYQSIVHKRLGEMYKNQQYFCDLKEKEMEARNRQNDLHEENKAYGKENEELKKHNEDLKKNNACLKKKLDEVSEELNELKDSSFLVEERTVLQTDILRLEGLVHNKEIQHAALKEHFEDEHYSQTLKYKTKYEEVNRYNNVLLEKQQKLNREVQELRDGLRKQKRKYERNCEELRERIHGLRSQLKIAPNNKTLLELQNKISKKSSEIAKLKNNASKLSIELNKARLNNSAKCEALSQELENSKAIVKNTRLQLRRKTREREAAILKLLQTKNSLLEIKQHHNHLRNEVKRIKNEFTEKVKQLFRAVSRSTTMLECAKQRHMEPLKAQVKRLRLANKEQLDKNTKLKADVYNLKKQADTFMEVLPFQAPVDLLWNEPLKLASLIEEHAHERLRKIEDSLNQRAAVKTRQLEDQIEDIKTEHTLAIEMMKAKLTSQHAQKMEKLETEMTQNAEVYACQIENERKEFETQLRQKVKECGKLRHLLSTQAEP